MITRYKNLIASLIFQSIAVLYPLLNLVSVANVFLDKILSTFFYFAENWEPWDFDNIKINYTNLHFTSLSAIVETKSFTKGSQANCKEHQHQKNSCKPYLIHLLVSVGNLVICAAGNGDYKLTAGAIERLSLQAWALMFYSHFICPLKSSMEACWIKEAIKFLS